MPRVTNTMKVKMRLEEIVEAGGVIVPGGRCWFYIYPIKQEVLFYSPQGQNEKWGIFFPSNGMDLKFTENQAKVVVEFFKQNKLYE